MGSRRPWCQLKLELEVGAANYVGHCLRFEALKAYVVGFFGQIFARLNTCYAHFTNRFSTEKREFLCFTSVLNNYNQIYTTV